MRELLLNSRIYQLYENEHRPEGPAPQSFRQLLQQRKHVFVVIEHPPHVFQKYLEGLSHEDFFSAAQASLTPRSAIEALEVRWHTLRETLKKQQRNWPAQLILLPRIHSDPGEREQTFFGEIRTDLLTWGKDIPFIFLGDYPTLLQIRKHIDKGLSPLGKELDVWLIESAATPFPVLQWLSGGEAETLVYLSENLPAEARQAAGTCCDALRSVAHELAKAMLSANSPFSLERRLRGLLDFSLEGKLWTADQTRLDDYLEHLCRLLPGSHDVYTPASEDALYLQKEKAKWRPFSMLGPAWQTLFAGGFIRYQAIFDDAYFHLRNPLLAYALARSERWQPSAPQLQNAINTPIYPSVIRNPLKKESVPAITSLDVFLDALLDRTSGGNGRYPDAWAVSQLSLDALTNKFMPGEWWKRIPVSELLICENIYESNF